MTPKRLRELVTAAEVPEGAERELERRWQERDHALNWLEKRAPDLARVAAGLAEALAHTIPKDANAQHPGRCALAAFEQLGER